MTTEQAEGLPSSARDTQPPLHHGDLEEEDMRETVINKGAIRAMTQIQYVRERGSRAADGPAGRA